MQDDFVEFSKDYVLFAHVTTQIATDKYQNLLSEKGGGGFPHIVFMDSEGNVIAKHESFRTAAAFAETGKKAKLFLDLKARAKKGNRKAKIEYALLSLEMGALKVADAEAKFKKLGKLSKEQQARLEAAKADAGVKEVLEGIRSREESQKAQETFYGWFKEGRPGPTGEQEFSSYYQMVLQAAERNKDAVSFEKALTTLKERFGSNPSTKRFFGAMEKKLQELRAGGK